MHKGIVRQRLQNQFLAGTGPRQPGDVVAWFGAVQAQEYEAAKWGLGQRMSGAATAADIERAFAEGHILRTHVLRPTWHFVTPADVHWLLELTGPRVRRTMASYHRKLGLHDRLVVRATSIIERALDDGRHLTRSELGEHLRRARIKLDSIQLGNLTMCAELERVICSGPRRGKLSTYALLAERAPKAARLSKDEALATLVLRYFTSHGPATARDFAWWSGLTSADAKRGLEMNNASGEDVGGRVYWTIGSTPAASRTDSTRTELLHLLPIYDEYLIAYRDRAAVPHGPAVIAGGLRASVTFQHALVIGGQVAGTWRTARSSRGVRMDVIPLRGITAREQRALLKTAGKYARFLGTPVEARPAPLLPVAVETKRRKSR